MTRLALSSRLKRVKLVVLDVDGVLTDGTFGITASGSEIKFFHAHDGAGIKYLRRAGIHVALLSGRSASAVEHRAKELGIRHVFQGYKHKLEGFEKLAHRTKIRPDQICFVGDDFPDIPVMNRVGLAVAVADARPEVLKAAHCVTHAEGGRGAVREICEKIIKAQGKWDKIIARYGLGDSDPEIGADS